MVDVTVRRISYTSGVLDKRKVTKLLTFTRQISPAIFCSWKYLATWRSDVNLKFSVSKTELIILSPPISLLLLLPLLIKCNRMLPKPKSCHFWLIPYLPPLRQSPSSRIHPFSLPLLWYTPRGPLLWTGDSNSYPINSASSLVAPSRKRYSIKSKSAYVIPLFKILPWLPAALRKNTKLQHPSSSDISLSTANLTPLLITLVILNVTSWKAGFFLFLQFLWYDVTSTYYLALISVYPSGSSLNVTVLIKSPPTSTYIIPSSTSKHNTYLHPVQKPCVSSRSQALPRIGAMPMLFTTGT